MIFSILQLCFMENLLKSPWYADMKIRQPVWALEISCACHVVRYTYRLIELEFTIGAIIVLDVKIVPEANFIFSTPYQ